MYLLHVVQTQVDVSDLFSYVYNLNTAIVAS